MNKPTDLKMDSLRFIQIVQSYGSNPKVWPENERSAAIKFSQRDDAKAVLEGEHDFDAMIAANPAPAPSEVLSAHILKAARATPPIANDRSPLYRRLAAFAAIALIAVTVTVSTGIFTPTQTEDPLYDTPTEFLVADMDALWDETFF